MTRISMFGVFFVFCITLTSTWTLSSSEEVSNEDLRKLATANNELAFNLHRKLASESSGNVFFSPFSISSVLGMLFYGARGETKQELRNALGYDKANLPSDLVSESFNRYLSRVLQNGNSSNGYVLNIANALLADERLGLLDEYRNAVQNLYKAKVSYVDFARNGPQIVQDVNDWVKEKTNGKIDKILDELDPATVLVLLNAVYFKGTWKTQFSPQSTYNNIFYNNGNEERLVQMMYTTLKLPYASIDDFQVLELPYNGNNVSMLFLLPMERDGLQAFEESLTPEKLADIQSSLHETEVDVHLPKFKLQYQKELSPAMEALGANQIFSAGSADFSGMTPNSNVMVSQILHKAVIEVNEEGSAAAAVTSVGIRPISAGFRNTEFRANHPFLFAIVDKTSGTDMILFMGRVNNL